MKDKLKEYIDSNLMMLKLKSIKSPYNYSSEELSTSNDKSINKVDLVRGKKDVDTYIDTNKDENIFHKLLFEYIDKKGLKDSDVYNKVNIDRRLFSKIRSDSNYHPSKETIILLGLSLELNEEEIEKLLGSSSYFLPKNNYFDLIIRFCFIEGIYNLMDVNELLEEYGCKVL